MRLMSTPTPTEKKAIDAFAEVLQQRNKEANLPYAKLASEVAAQIIVMMQPVSLLDDFSAAFTFLTKIDTETFTPDERERWDTLNSRFPGLLEYVTQMERGTQREAQ